MCLLEDPQQHCVKVKVAATTEEKSLSIDGVVTAPDAGAWKYFRTSSRHFWHPQHDDASDGGWCRERAQRWQPLKRLRGEREPPVIGRIKTPLHT